MNKRLAPSLRLRTLRLSAAIALAATLTLSDAALAQRSAAHKPPTFADVEYARAGDEALLLDLYLPAEANGAPLLVWVHGGAWQFGSKSDMPIGALGERGYAIASVEFRQATVARFPAQAHDIKAAIRFLRARAGDYGYDATRIAILGASSGGHLAALIATTNGDAALEGSLGEHRDVSSDVQAAVSFFGASNLTTILKQSTPAGLRVREPALERLLGDAPENAVELARLASPVFHVSAGDPPLLLLHGDQDPQMPINQSHELEGAYAAQGLEARFVVVHGAGHGGAVFFDEEHLRLVAEFLDRHLRGQSVSRLDAS
ncbi:MAG TPA: alpha/beta fold hydrolase [Gammaproteobacteria bacterium]|nr:alpha/beta fold hydrolase [Gammaproteobacteria bacterium]